jgi:hypothetical protein
VATPTKVILTLPLVLLVVVQHVEGAASVNLPVFDGQVIATRCMGVVSSGQGGLYLLVAALLSSAVPAVLSAQGTVLICQEIRWTM